MLSAKLAAWITLTVVLVVVLTPCEGSDTFDRQMRAPFNGMRGKRFPLNLNMYRKRAPFNGMRGKRDYEDIIPYQTDGDDLDLWTTFQEEKRGRGFGSGFVGMRG